MWILLCRLKHYCLERNDFVIFLKALLGIFQINQVVRR